MEKHRDMAAKGKGNGHQHRRYPAEHVLRKIHHCTFGRKISRRPFLGYYPQNFTFYLSKILTTSFLVTALFYDFLPFTLPSFLFLNSTFSPKQFFSDLFLTFYP